MFKKLLATVAAVALVFSSAGYVANAEEAKVNVGDTISVSNLGELEEGTYELDASLSCYVNAMGGIDFGDGLLEKTVIEVEADGTATMAMTFGTASLTIYGVPANTFIGTLNAPGYYDGTTWKTAEYKLSANTATSANGEENYVETVKVPVSEVSDAYQLALYVNSNVMGTQFGGENAKYKAVLSVNWANTKVLEIAEDDVADSEDGKVEDNTKDDTKDDVKDNVTNDTNNNTNNSGNENTSNTVDSSTDTSKKENTTTVSKVISVSKLSELEPGTYGLKANLSCYVNAMGGVEFGQALLKNAELIVAKDGSASIKLYYGTSSVTIYGVTADTYVGTSTSNGAGTIAYYNGSEWVDAKYTTNSAGQVTTMTFPISKIQNTYKLAMVVGSNVMSTQFGADSNYDATLTINWNQVTTEASGSAVQTSDAVSVLPAAALLVSIVAIAFVLNEKRQTA